MCNVGLVIAIPFFMAVVIAFFLTRKATRRFLVIDGVPDGCYTVWSALLGGIALLILSIGWFHQVAACIP